MVSFSLRRTRVAGNGLACLDSFSLEPQRPVLLTLRWNTLGLFLTNLQIVALISTWIGDYFSVLVADEDAKFYLSFI